MRNGKGVALRFLGGTCGLLGDSCGRPELPRRDANEALEVVGELALVREAGVRGDLPLRASVCIDRSNPGDSRNLLRSGTRPTALGIFGARPLSRAWLRDQE